MNRLPFVLPDSTRFIWSREGLWWKDKLPSLVNAHFDIEIQSVIHDDRAGTIQFIPIEQFQEYAKRIQAMGLFLYPISLTGGTKTYSSSPNGGKDTVRVYITKDSKNLETLDLGYPECCKKFYEQYWEKEHYVDTTWIMCSKDDKNIPLHLNDWPISTNILLRWLGIRPVFHLPCSPYCEESKWIGEENLGLWKKFHPELHKLIVEMLNWPVEWSALHGYARIKTPVCEIVSRTDATAELYIVKRKGIYIPKDIIPMSSLRVKKSHNGFTSIEEETTNHNWLFHNINKERIYYTSVIDLGCGDGKLLNKFGTTNKIGIDNDLKFASCKNVTPGNIKEIKHDEMKQKFDLALIAEQRFKDTYQSKDEALKHIATFANAVAIYNYNSKLFEYTKF